MKRLEGKVALISGAARGIGAATAKAMLAEGARVVIGDVRDDDGWKLLEGLGSAAAYVHLDVTDRAQWAAAVAKAVETYGRLDVLVNNAGIALPGRIDEYSPASWDTIVAVNLTGVFNGIQAAIPALKRAGGGSIVNISSILGLQGAPAAPGYVATKFGVRGLTKAAAIDLGPYRIRVNSVHPGYIATAMTAPVPPDVHDVALHRAGAPDDVARLVVFLASDESSFSTGAEFVVDGGEHAGPATGGSLSAATRFDRSAA